MPTPDPELPARHDWQVLSWQASQAADEHIRSENTRGRGGMHSSRAGTQVRAGTRGGGCPSCC